ncbi:hypothetical protein L3i23_04000 [Herbiconiux sp. L3-i23]|nr:hypothetical protein L3i23_04000 [Herbiconiux sp. L3-i23]
MPPRVGVIVRTKERPAFLARALRDIGAQTSAEWRVIVVNDGGATSAVDDVVESWEHADRAEVIHLPPGEGGRCAAANRGVAAAASEFVVLHDDDDLWDPDFLADTVGWLENHPDAGGVSAATTIVYEELRNGVWTESGRAPFWQGMSRISLGEMLVVNRIVPISFLYRRELHDRFGGYDESLDAVEDWDFYLRVLPHREIGYLSARPLALWTQRPGVRGAAANSMFELSGEHARDDAVVRDRALAQWIDEHGTALPLAIAASERRLGERIEELDKRYTNLVNQLRRETSVLRPFSHGARFLVDLWRRRR